MNKLLLINVSANTGSTGRIAEEIGVTAMAEDYESLLAYGRDSVPGKVGTIKIGNRMDFWRHVAETRLMDRHGFASRNATRKFIAAIEKFAPDIVNIHNLHGYYINIALLFEFLKESNIPIVWTLHDCWPFTGHCSYFDRFNCQKWQNECHHCPNKRGYPESWLLDNSRNNYYHKKNIFNGLKKLTIVTPSYWLADHVKNSFLKEYPRTVIHNGTDIEQFKPCIDEKIPKKYGLEKGKRILGVASTWDRRKGLDDFIALRKELSPDIQIVLVGLNAKQISSLPAGIRGISRTENRDELAALYAMADVFVNPTYVDNFPTTNIEALACGTPVITYRTGGSPEAINEKTGIVVEKGNIRELKNAVETVLNNGKEHYAAYCRERAVSLFDKNERYNEYIELFNQMIQEKD